MIRVGIGGWDFAPWHKTFYPPDVSKARALDYASRHLTSIEINGTFYRHQSAATFAAWGAATPENFVFAVKAHRAATHGKLLAGLGPAIEHFLASGITALGKKLGPILWQFPHTRKFDADQAAAFLNLLPAMQDGIRLRHAIEARHPSFDDPAWISLLRKHDFACVIVDSDKQALRGDRTADFLYLRLQRNSVAAPEHYAPDGMRRWAARLRTWADGGSPDDLSLTDTSHTPPRLKPDCFAYCIAGEKEVAPLAAKALMSHLKAA